MAITGRLDGALRTRRGDWRFLRARAKAYHARMDTAHAAGLAGRLDGPSPLRPRRAGWSPASRGLGAASSSCRRRRPPTQPAYQREIARLCEPGAPASCNFYTSASGASSRAAARRDRRRDERRLPAFDEERRGAISLELPHEDGAGGVLQLAASGKGPCGAASGALDGRSAGAADCPARCSISRPPPQGLTTRASLAAFEAAAASAPGSEARAARAAASPALLGSPPGACRGRPRTGPLLNQRWHAIAAGPLVSSARQAGSRRRRSERERRTRKELYLRLGPAPGSPGGLWSQLFGTRILSTGCRVGQILSCSPNGCRNLQFA